MTDLVAVSPDGTIIEHSNQGRSEAQMQIGDAPTAIQLSQVSTRSVIANPIVWVGLLLVLSLLAFFVLRIGREPDQV